MKNDFFFIKYKLLVCGYIKIFLIRYINIGMIFLICDVLCIKNFFFFQINEKFIKFMEGLCFDIFCGKFLGEVIEIKDVFFYGLSVLEVVIRMCERMYFNVMIFF